MSKADYSIASQEERDNVIRILQRNANQLIEQKQVQNAENLRSEVDRLCGRVRNGDVVTGKDFEKLVRLFKKQPI
ncbi:hypothetical protein GWO43_25830 [candidate division KSB1 bacterium]|nr:hypothetical protein [candidate division KSB1 bacterium]NIR69233.1 hypothetical protein [candidate division KSB1 bacterium]NIS27407.1 hypothetical protein [candidate division KSB1 bacterium]NIT74232.1 hypothetical protein [candidate division KSB1 bacterium]NIU28124.1 hypothetical protein [candidate division KSB1 bacterium]